MTSERRCPIHIHAGIVQQDNRSTVFCESGHRVEKWIVVDVDSQRVIGAASILGGLLTLPAIVPSAGPARACKRGHLGRWTRSGAGWRCSICRYETQRRYLDRQEARA